jgi:hypothetical protein
MATYTASDLLTKPLPGIDQASNYFGTISNSVATATGDLLRPLKLPAGFRMSVMFVNVRTAFGTTAPASIGISHVDGSTVPALVYGTATAATVITAATDTIHASTGNKLVMPQIGAWTTSKESYLEVLFGTIGTGAAGVADYSVIGEFAGSK